LKHYHHTLKRRYIMRRPNATILMLTAISVIAVDTVFANRLIGLVDTAIAQQIGPVDQPQQRFRFDRPDLVPVDSQGNPPMGQNPVRYCQREPRTGALLVKVKNQGTGEALPRGANTFTIRVEFFAQEQRFIQVSEVQETAIPPGATKTYVMPDTIMSQCFDPDCDFLITIDRGRDVRDEIIIGNNHAYGRCPFQLQIPPSPTTE
jgi:hypothetical protein